MCAQLHVTNQKDHVTSHTPKKKTPAPSPPPKPITRRDGGNKSVSSGRRSERVRWKWVNDLSMPDSSAAAKAREALLSDASEVVKGRDVAKVGAVVSAGCGTRSVISNMTVSRSPAREQRSNELRRVVNCINFGQPLLQ